MSVLTLEQVGYSYQKNVCVLRGINYQFEKGMVYAITGRSGTGKTTLLSLLSGLTTATEGRILFQDRDLSKMDRYRYRSRDVGVVFQSFNLLPHMTAVENVILSMDIAGKKQKDKRKTAMELLAKVGLTEEKANRRILKLSGGEQQRVAIARALSYQPDVILADEPTGNLDLGTQEEIIEILKNLAQNEDKCVIIVTHSPEVAQSADAVFELAPYRPDNKSQKAAIG